MLVDKGAAPAVKALSLSLAVIRARDQRRAESLVHQLCHTLGGGGVLTRDELAVPAAAFRIIERNSVLLIFVLCIKLGNIKSSRKFDCNQCSNRLA